jgi:hypothetical protein
MSVLHPSGPVASFPPGDFTFSSDLRRGTGKYTKIEVHSNGDSVRYLLISPDVRISSTVGPEHHEAGLVSAFLTGVLQAGAAPTSSAIIDSYSSSAPADAASGAELSRRFDSDLRQGEVSFVANPTGGRTVGIRANFSDLARTAQANTDATDPLGTALFAAVGLTRFLDITSR